MPRLQVYLPDDLHAELKRRQLPASELLQAAVRAEMHRLDLLAATDVYLDAQQHRVVPTPAERERADIIARRVANTTRSTPSRPTPSRSTPSRSTPSRPAPGQSAPGR